MQCHQTGANSPARPYSTCIHVLHFSGTILEHIPALWAEEGSSPVLGVPGAPRGSQGDDLAAGSHRTGPDAALSERDINMCKSQEMQLLGSGPSSAKSSCQNKSEHILHW